MTEQRIDMGSGEAVAWALHRELAELPVVLRLVIDGEPVSKSRARFTGRGSKSKAYTPEKTRQAEERIAWLARQAGVRGEPDGEHTFGIFAKFFCGTWQRRDVDNMLKLVADALNGIVWVDDAQVSEVAAAVQRGVNDPRTHVLIYRTPALMPPTRPCETCGTPVRQYKSQPNRYCSKECSGLAQRKRVELTCLECGNSYELPAYRAARVKRPFCSESCRYRGTRVQGPCMQCGRHVSRPRSLAKRKLFCSTACSSKYQIGRPRGGGDLPNEEAP